MAMNAVEAYEKANGIGTACCVKCGKVVSFYRTWDEPEWYWVFDLGESEGMEHACVQPPLVVAGIRGMQRVKLHHGA